MVSPMVRTVIRAFLEAEMAEAVAAQKGEGVEARLGYRSGYYARSLITGRKARVAGPKIANGRFSTEIFERYQRSEKALVAALTQMYIQWVPTRKVTAISEELCGHSFVRARSARSTRSWMWSWDASRGAISLSDH